jgi:hypothetical protein
VTDHDVALGLKSRRVRRPGLNIDGLVKVIGVLDQKSPLGDRLVRMILARLPGVAASTGSACHAGLVKLSPVLQGIGGRS